jgi:hypothetical protein
MPVLEPGTVPLEVGSITALEAPGCGVSGEEGSSPQAHTSAIAPAAIINFVKRFFIKLLIYTTLKIYSWYGLRTEKSYLEHYNVPKLCPNVLELTDLRKILREPTYEKTLAFARVTM